MPVLSLSFWVDHVWRGHEGVYAEGGMQNWGLLNLHFYLLAPAGFALVEFLLLAPWAVLPADLGYLGEGWLV